jgi:uncharacterized coiled-coil protein SlyX
MSVFVVRAFVQLREMLSAHRELAARLEALERKVGSHDQTIAGLIDAIRQLMTPVEPKKRGIGFIVEKRVNPERKENFMFIFSNCRILTRLVLCTVYARRGVY